jgi:hypothetical protein
LKSKFNSINQYDSLLISGSLNRTSLSVFACFALAKMPLAPTERKSFQPIFLLCGALFLADSIVWLARCLAVPFFGKPKRKPPAGLNSACRMPLRNELPRAIQSMRSAALQNKKPHSDYGETP